jgi:cytidylate kinase
MTSAETLSAWNAYIDCQGECHASLADKKAEQPFVTISRQTGAGGITIGQKLVLYLRERDKKATCPWTVIDRNLVKRVIEAHHLSKNIAEYMPEGKVSEIRDVIEEMFGLHPAEFALVHRTIETIAHLSQMGNVVIVGRGANVVTRRFPNGFHVRLIGSMERRVPHVQEYYGLNVKEAVQKIKAEDKGRRDYLKQNFGKDIDDPLLYDLVINTDRISHEEAATIIGNRVVRIREK